MLSSCGTSVTMQFFPAQSGYSLIEMTLTDPAGVERELEKATTAATAAHPPSAIKF